MNMHGWGDQGRPSRGKDILQGPTGIERIWIVRDGIGGKLV